MTAPPAIPVLIVGGGPTGMAAAALLAAQGVESVIVERHTEPYPLPRAVHVDDETRRILQQIGIEEQFAKVSRPLPGLRLLDSQHRVFGEIMRGTTPRLYGHAPDSMFDQPVLEDLMRDALAGLPEVRWRTGTDVLEVTQTEDLAQVKVRSQDGVEEVLTTRFVLGCDGANSLVRTTIGARLRDFRFEERWMVVDINAARPLDAWDGLEQVCDPERAGTFMQVVGLRYRFEFQMKDDETLDALVERLHSFVQPWTADIPYEVVRAAEYTFRARVTDRWRDGRLFLLGDAAHTTPPFIGQGLCAGLRDASNLSWKLALHLRGDAGDDLLDTYAQERDPQASHVVRMAVFLGTAMTGGQARMARVRQFAFGQLFARPLINRRLAENIVPPLTTGPLVQRGGLSGALLPQPTVHVDGAEVPLDAVLGTGFVLVSRGPLRVHDHQVAARLEARIVRVHAPHMPMPQQTDGIVDAIDPLGVLHDWMGSARSVLVRPDRVVMATDPRPEHLPASLYPLTAA